AEIKFFERKFPSCNMVLVLDERPIVVDAGFGSDALLTKQLLEPYVNPADISMIVNTHYHTDHSGGNHFFQQQYGTKIAAHKWDAKMINAFDFESGASDYLDQKLEPYHVDVLLDDGDEVDTGEKSFSFFTFQGIRWVTSCCMSRPIKCLSSAICFTVTMLVGSIFSVKASVRSTVPLKASNG